MCQWGTDIAYTTYAPSSPSRPVLHLHGGAISFRYVCFMHPLECSPHLWEAAHDLENTKGSMYWPAIPIQGQAFLLGPTTIPFHCPGLLCFVFGPVHTSPPAYYSMAYPYYPYYPPPQLPAPASHTCTGGYGGSPCGGELISNFRRG